MIKEENYVKILAIMGSPHKGNSLEFTQRIEEQLQQLGDVAFEYFLVGHGYPIQSLYMT